MNSGYRHDVINEHINDWNWRKVITMGTFLPPNMNYVIADVHVAAQVAKDLLIARTVLGRKVTAFRNLSLSHQDKLTEWQNASREPTFVNKRLFSPYRMNTESGEPVHSRR